MRMGERVWSKFQQAIFAFVESGTGNAIIEAVAGSGKTTTIVEALKRVRGSSLFLAFNKAIATELGNRGVNARTFHSMCYSVVSRYLGGRKANEYKLKDIIDRVVKSGELAQPQLYAAFMKRMVGLAKNSGIGAGLLDDTEQNWVAIAEHHDVELESEDADFGKAIELSRWLLKLSNAAQDFDFDDMLYLTVKHGLVLPKFDFVFVDEAQDTNQIQSAILQKVMHTGSRLVAVGDPAQAIYGFRGADSMAMQNIAQTFNCIKLPLTVSYRCPRAVVEYAHQWVDHIEAAPNAPEGDVNQWGAWSLKDLRPNDFVVSRTTKPIISLAYALLRAQIPAYVMGREIGAGLKSLIDKMKAKGIERLYQKLADYEAREIEKATVKKNAEAKIAAIQDKVETIFFLINALGENERTIPKLHELIDKLFDDRARANAVRLSTIHKAKGLESDRVLWLNYTWHAQWARQEWQKQQERNLCYVATTRAVKELVLFELKELTFTDQEAADELHVVESDGLSAYDPATRAEQK
jgi:DNA helicase II / ATP-dependent DNA helicase PcrA